MNKWKFQISLGILAGAAIVCGAGLSSAQGSEPGTPSAHERTILSNAASGFIRGDANNDGEITLADVIHVAVYLYGAGPAPIPTPDSGDANCDNVVGPRDVVYLINYVLRGGPQPKCPS